MAEVAEKEEELTENPLGTEPVGRLLVQFSIPGIISLVVNSLYNMVDQVYIGNFVGELGNAATNIAFPLTTLCMSLAALFGFGGAAGFNLSMGRKEKERAPYFFGNSAVMLFLCGVVIMAITLLFLTPLLKAFGSPDDVLPYAQSYVGITAFGFPFYVFSAGAVHLIRADGKPRASMACNLTGAIINVGLDTLFVAILGFGIRGAALATIIGQIAAACVAFRYLRHTQTVKLERRHLRLQSEYVGESAHLGMAPCFNQLAGMVVQITMNNSLKHFGEGSSEAYYDFAVRYFRIYLFFTFANFLPIMSANFFTAIGKPMQGTILSLSRQIIFFLPLLIIFPRIFPILFGLDGIDGIIYVGPVADALAITLAIVMVVREMRDLTRLAREESGKVLKSETNGSEQIENRN